MGEPELQGKDKIFSKMTRDGLYEENVSQGTSERVSQKKAKFEYNERTEEDGYQKYRREAFRERAESREEKKDTHNKRDKEDKESKEEHRDKKTDAKSEKRKGSTYSSNASSEKEYEKEVDFEYSKKTKKVIKRAENIERKRDRAFQKAPKRNRLRFEDKYGSRLDPMLMKMRASRSRLHFENRADMNAKGVVFDLSSKKIRSSKRKKRRRIANYAQYKTYKDADDNAGIESSKHGIYAGRKIGRGLARGKDKILDPIFNSIDRYYKLEKKAARLNSKASYLKFLDKNPDADPKMQFKKMLQRRRFKKKFAEAYRKTHNAEYAASFAQAAIIKSSRRAVEMIKRVRKILAVCGATGILVMIVAFMLFSCAMVATNNTAIQSGSIYPAENLDITNADSYYTEKEADLQDLIDHMEETHSGYDEYQYHLDSIGHDSIALLSYLSVVFQDFTFEQIQAELDAIFEEQYELTFREEVQTRTRSYHDDVTGETHEEEYEWKILHITLTNHDLKSILEGKITDESDKEIFDVYNDVDGGRQVFSNPFDFDWINDISSPFGWRIHPISGEKKFHTGIDIAEPAGTPIKAVMTGTVVIAKYSDSAGNYVGIQDKDGYLTKYMHCLSINVSEGDEVKTGDVIGKVGSTGNSTGNHLHLDVIDPNGNYLNPLYMVSHYVKEVDNNG